MSITTASKAEKWSCGHLNIKISLLYKKETMDIGDSLHFNILITVFTFLPEYKT